MLTFTSLTGVSSVGPFFIRVKWGRDGAWCQNPHITQATKKDANGNHVWTETIVIQSKFDWKKDAIVMHIYESGFFSNTHIGDATVIFNQLVMNQATPVSLNLTQRLGTHIVAGKLNIQVKALDFGHELVQVAPQPAQFQPHYFVASSLPLASPSEVPAPSSAVTLGTGQQVYIQPMASVTGAAGSPYAPQNLSLSTPLTTMPTANGGFMFYAMPPGSVHTASPHAPHASHAPHAPLHAEPAPSYASLDLSQQYTADFTYEAPSAPTETLVPPSSISPKPHIAEQSPPPISNLPPPPYHYNGESLI
jgi:hypothetical protein